MTTDEIIDLWAAESQVNEKGVMVFGEAMVRTLDVPQKRKGPAGWLGYRERYGRPLTNWNKFPNGATYVGVNKILDSGFRNQAQITAWYIGLIDNDGFSAVNVNDTSASHSGWTELTDYTSGTRLAWSPSAAASGVLTISSAVTFTTNATVDIRGIFLASSNTKESAVDIIWATAVESAGRNITSGQQYQCFYTIQFTPAS